MPHHRFESPARRRLLPAALALLVLTFLTGGGSYDRGWGDAAAQLLAWPVLVLALYLLMRNQAARMTWLVLGVAATVPVVLTLQGWFGMSLTPWASERGAWSTLPAVAMLAAVLALPTSAWPVLLWTIVGLVGFSVVLAFLQLGAPQDSLLNPFPEWAPALGGVFANPNHHGTVLAMALLWLLAWGLQARRDAVQAPGGGPRLVQWVLAIGAALVLLAVLPLTGSRAMVLIAAGAMVLLPVVEGGLWQGLRHRGRRRRAVVVTAALAVATAAALVIVSAWVKTDSELEHRGALATATAAMARDAMPWGTGVGSFVPWFDAHAPEALQQYEYFNHAHNEYVQWWLESGVLGLAWIALLGLWLVWAFPRGPRSALQPYAVTAWLSMLVVLVHSVVDYPLRTPSVMVVAAVMAGLATRVTVKRGEAAKAEKKASQETAAQLA